MSPTAAATPLSPTLPQTLLEMAGAPQDSARLSEAVLLIIDAQREYVDGKLPLAGVDAALRIGGTLLDRARTAGTPVIHILHRGGGRKLHMDVAGIENIGQNPHHAVLHHQRRHAGVAKSKEMDASGAQNGLHGP